MKNDYVGGSAMSKIWQRTQNAITWLTDKLNNKADVDDVPNEATDAEVDAILDQIIGEPDGSLAGVLDELAARIAERISGVKVGGMALVPDANGVVDIPNAGVIGRENTYGLIRVYPQDPENGIQIGGNTAIAINPASESRINSRTGNMAIIPPNLNHAVKATLTDSNRMALSDAEKAEACQTIGATPVRTWRDIELISIDNPTESDRIVRTAEPNGKPYNFRAIRYIIAIAPGTSVADYGMVYMYNSGNTICNFEHGNTTNTNTYWVYSKGIFSVDDSVGNFYTRWDSTGSGYTQIYSRVPFESTSDLGGGLWNAQRPAQKIQFPTISGAKMRIRIQAIDW